MKFLRNFLAGATALALCQGCSVNQDDVQNAAELSRGLKAKTFARFVPERADDFAWENDVIAFRAFGPALRTGTENSGIDCWLKRVNYPIIDKWYKLALEDNVSYHEDNGEGLDNYHVGDSAGCGGTAIWKNNTRHPLETFTDWKILSQSDAKTEFVLTYENTIDGKAYKETKHVSVELGQRVYSVVSTFYINNQPAKNIQVAVGVATHDGLAAPTWDKNEGWLAAWEVKDGYGLGTGVVVDVSRLIDVQIIDEPDKKDKSHALLIVSTDKKGQVRYSAGYGWEKAGVITSAKQWQQYLSRQARK